MNNSEPLVSVITPVFNGEEYLAETLKSILSSSYVPLEIIVVDDGSTDSSLSVARNVLSGSDRRFRVIHQRNAGEAVAVNVGIEQAQGEFVMVVNCDDPISRDLISKSTDAMRADPRIVVTYPDWTMIRPDSSPIRSIRTKEFSLDLLFGDFVCLPGPGAMIRKSAIKGTLRDEAVPFAADLLSWLKLSLQGDFKRIPETLATWRSHAAGQTATARGREYSESYLKAVQAFLAELQHHDSPRHAELRKQAIASAYFAAAVQGLYSKQVPSFYLLVKSFFTFYRRRRNVPKRRRSFLLVCAILLLPIGRKFMALNNRLRNS